jgi:hypothetical protein
LINGILVFHKLYGDYIPLVKRGEHLSFAYVVKRPHQQGDEAVVDKGYKHVSAIRTFIPDFGGF